MTSGPESQRNVLEIARSLEGPRGFLWHGAVIVLSLVMALAVNSLLMIAALLVRFSAFFLQRRGQFPWFRFPLHVGFVATALMMGLWSLLIPLLWQFGLLKARTLCRFKNHPSGALETHREIRSDSDG